MSSKNDQDRDLRDAARELALHLKYAEEDDNGRLIDLGEVSIEDEDDEEDEGMNPAREEIQTLMDEGHELVEIFEEDLELAIEYLEKVLEDARPG